jgi:hypothetical protein
MKEELDSYLVSKYSKIFRNRFASIKTSCMSFGFEHGDGWFWIIDELCDSIQTYIDNNNKYRTLDQQISQVIANQVKEKFGYLNFYYDGGDDVIHGMVSFAESLSQRVCEECGTMENVGKTSGWIKIICKDCYEKGNMYNVWEEKPKYVPEISAELRKVKLDKINLDNTEQ